MQVEVIQKTNYIAARPCHFALPQAAIALHNYWCTIESSVYSPQGRLMGRMVLVIPLQVDGGQMRHVQSCSLNTITLLFRVHHTVYSHKTISYI